MKAKLLLLLLLIFPIADLFYSCCRGIETDYITYTHKEVTAKNMENGVDETIVNFSEINKNAYGIRIYITRGSSSVAQMLTSVTNLAHACTPAEIFLPRDSVVSLKIFTVNDFDEQHLKNADISTYFKTQNGISIEENLKSLLYTFDGGMNDRFRLDYFLTTPPTTNSKHQFKIHVLLSDGRVLETQTNEIELI